MHVAVVVRDGYRRFNLFASGEVSAGPSSRFSEICSLDGWFCYVLFLLEMGWYQQEGKIAPLMIDGAHRPFCRS